MEKKLITEAERFLNSRYHSKRRTRVMRGVALLVVIATVSALIMPAVTMSNEVECGQEEHIHTQSCYEVRQAAPEPVLTCAAGASGEVVIHTHDGYCYDSQGNLICGLPEAEAHVHGPECYQEQRTLLCEQVADPGHQHGASCYSYVRVEEAGVERAGEYICGMQEGDGAHQHTEECYPEERAEEPLCGLPEGDILDGEGNVVQGGHVHTDGCWMVRVHEKLVCGQEEAEDEYDEQGVLIRQGHHHDAGCRLTGDELCAQYGCGRHETAGHTHTDACAAQADVQTDAQGERWEKTLVCQEEEREPGHVHADGCYEIAQVLTCRKQELQAHTHDAACRDESGTLICGKAETLVHQHSDACRTVPEGGPEEAEVLVCGQEEHTHTDLCYVKARPETEKYYCGMEEHIHNQDCRFSSGELKCTIPEHIHIDDCLTPPSEETVEVEEVSVEVDETFTHDTELFHMEISVTGTAVVRTYTTVMEMEEPDVPMAQSPFVGGFLSFLFGPFVETASAASAEEFDESEFAAPEPASDPAGSDEDYSLEPSTLPGQNSETAQPEIEFTVNELDLNSEEVRAAVELAQENGQTVLTALSVTAWDSISSSEVDLSGCKITGVVTMTPHMTSMLSEMSSAALSAEEIPGEGQDEGDESDEEVILTTLNEMGGEVSRETIDLQQEEVSADVELAYGATLFSLRRSDPGEEFNFYVEYYAYLDRPIQDAKDVPSGVDYKRLPFIDTSAVSKDPTVGLRLQNGVELPQTHLFVNSATSEVLRRPELIQIYTRNTEKFQTTLEYEQTLNTDYLDNQKLGGEDDSMGTKVHYSVKEVWVGQSADGPWTVYYYGDRRDTSKTGNMPSNITFKQVGNTLEELKRGLIYTNKVDAASEDGKEIILLEEGTIVRLVYEEQSHTETVNADFYDYDISDGTITGNTLLVGKKGINSEKNYEKGTAEEGTAHLAFGNGPGTAPTGWGTENLNGLNINMANTMPAGTNALYRRCAFGLVTGLDENGCLIYAKGITAPNLFNEGGAIGKAGAVTYPLIFSQKGDTFTLSAVGGDAKLNNLDHLVYTQNAFNTDVPMNSNKFWPMDNAPTAGTPGHDPMFGQSEFQYTLVGIGDSKSNPVTDGTPKVDHNPYFGMDFSIQFTLFKEYTGPLEYFFYGDDDMWVFLDGKLVCDIGGVHQSIGEYVDLRDYLPEGSSGTHKLTFFYTERGASGSTCWMQFTLPNFVALAPPGPSGDSTSLTVQKLVAGDAAPDDNMEYTFSLVLGNGTNQNTLQGKKLPSNETVSLVFQPVDGVNTTQFTLKANESIIISGVPKNTQYKIVEQAKLNNCVVSYTGTTSGSAQGDTAEGSTSANGAAVTFTNTFNECYELPETGGGTRVQWYTMACVPLLAAGCLWYKKRSEGEGAED